MFGNDRTALRTQYATAWRKARDQQALTPLESALVTLIGEHPEYHALLETPAVELAQAEFRPEDGGENPFLHMGMHLALREQVGTDRPAGIRRLHRRLAARHGSAHAAEHLMMGCLGQVLWEAQQSRLSPDEARYLDCLRRL